MSAAADEVGTGGYILASGEGDPRRHTGHLFDWKAVGEQTGGTLALVEIEGWRGGEPPVHYHTHEDELFYMLEGEATFLVGDETRRGGPGMFVWAPRNIRHGFAFETKHVRMLVGFLPAGQEAVFHAFSTPDPQRARAAEPEPADLSDFAEIEAMDNRYGVVYVGPPLRDLLGEQPTAR